MSGSVPQSGQDDSGPSVPPAPGGPPPGGPPGGGGIPPILAAIARNRMQTPPSAPGMGTQGGALQKVMMAVDLLQQALPALGAGSEHHRAVLKAITDISKHLGGTGSPGQGAQQTAIQDMMRNQVRNAILQRLMMARGGPPGGGAPSPAPDQGGPGMSPSTPLPGA